METNLYIFLALTALWLWQASERASSLGRRRLDVLLTASSHLLYAVLAYFALFA